MRRSLTIIAVALLVLGSTANVFANTVQVKVPDCSIGYKACVAAQTKQKLSTSECDAVMKKTLQSPAPGGNSNVHLWRGKTLCWVG